MKKRMMDGTVQRISIAQLKEEIAAEKAGRPSPLETAYRQSKIQPEEQPASTAAETAQPETEEQKEKKRMKRTQTSRASAVLNDPVGGDNRRYLLGG